MQLLKGAVFRRLCQRPEDWPSEGSKLGKSSLSGAVACLQFRLPLNSPSPLQINIKIIACRMAGVLHYRNSECLTSSLLAAQ